MDDETLQKLLRFKRQETPSPAYFDAFLREFHQRQRRELLKTSSLGILFERVNTYLSDPRSQAWAYAPVMAVFVVAFYVIIGMTAETSIPSVPSLANVSMEQAKYAFNDAPAVDYRTGGPTVLNTVDNVPLLPIQASAFLVTPRLQLPLSRDEAFQQLQLISN
ncbi:hypothetical protein N8586_04175 [Verrucomicrobiales bacterium]|nr:hypothetical protein [Verrucomicrobiales bacterium]